MRQASLRSRNFIIAAIIALSGVLGWQFTELATVSSHNCESIKVIAGITHESVQRAASPQTRKLIAKINFPGLTHEELEKLVKQSVAREVANLRKLERVRSNSCG
jgi:predicted negative regulator of RcsB-dependent stress response